MEILIVGLIVVALMAYASTKIKKRAAEAYDAEMVVTDRYSLLKPEGFLHVVGGTRHEFEAYSKEYGDADEAHLRKATIEVDVIRDTDLKGAVQRLRNTTTQFTVSEETETIYQIETEELANETPLKGFYKLVATLNGVYQLRFIVLPKHVDEYLRKIDETVDSFAITS